MIYIQYALVIAIAYMAGKLITRINFPPVLGWVFTGIILGPNIANMLSFSTMSTEWFFYIDSIAKLFVGVMVGYGLVWATIKKSGKQLFILELTKNLVCYVLVSGVFALIFNYMDIPVALSLVLGSIACVFAPGPTMSVVAESKAEGPLAQMTILSIPVNQVTNIVIFYLTLSFVQGSLLGGTSSLVSQMTVSLFAPAALGAVLGLITSFAIPKSTNSTVKMLLFCAVAIIGAVLSIWIGEVYFNVSSLDTFLVGLIFTAIFVNVHSQAEVKMFDPFYNIALLVLLVNVASRLDVMSFLGAWPLVVTYIVVRIAGTYAGCRVGGKIAKAPTCVCNYLGFTLLPHIGVALARAAVAFESLSPASEEYATLILLIISGASVLNEFFALYMSNKAYHWAGEIPEECAERAEREISRAV